MCVCARDGEWNREDGRGRALLQHLGQRALTAPHEIETQLPEAENKARTGVDPYE